MLSLVGETFRRTFTVYACARVGKREGKHATPVDRLVVTMLHVLGLRCCPNLPMAYVCSVSEFAHGLCLLSATKEKRVSGHARTWTHSPSVCVCVCVFVCVAVVGGGQRWGSGSRP